MTITTRSADGVLHQFPDGTDQGVIDSVMKQYAQQSASPAGGAAKGEGGLLRNFAAGTVEGLTGAVGFLADLGVAQANAESGYSMFPEGVEQPQLGAVTSYLNNQLGRVGLNPDAVPAESFPERAVRFAGSGASTALLPGGGVGSTIQRVGTGMSVGLGAETAREIAPEPLKPLAALIGGIKGGLAAQYGPRGVSYITRAAGNVAAPFTAGVSPQAAERLAASTITNRATDVGAVRQSLEGGAAEIVPGSSPTTFQQTGDVGLGTLERQVATRHPDQFAQRRADQNAARLTSLQSIQQGGNPSDVASFFRSQLDELDQETARHADEMLASAQAHAARMGGTRSPEAYGEDLRTIALKADEAANARERALWDAVDPDNSLTGNMQTTIDGAKRVAGGVNRMSKPMSGEESAIFDAAQSLSPLSPVSDLIALRSRAARRRTSKTICVPSRT